MSFQSLPAELQLDILELLEPQWSFNFAVASKEHYTMCRTVLDHHTKMFSEWEIIDFQGDDDDNLDFEHRTTPWSVLEAVLDDPRIGWYVKQLDIPSSGVTHWDSGDSPLPERYRYISMRATRELEDLYPEIPGTSSSETLFADLEKSIDEGFADAAIASLIHQLPYLEIINITDSIVPCFQEVFYRIAMEYGDPAKASRLPLQRLRTATLEHWDTEGSCDAAWAFIFLCIPSLQTFAARHMGTARRNCDPERLGIGSGRLSNVTELFLVESVLDLNELEALLKMTKTLKRLTYTTEGYVIYQGRSDRTDLIGCIVSSVADSLEKLVLDEDPDKYMWDDVYGVGSISFRTCSKLRILNLNWSILFPEEHSLVDASPLSQGFYNADDDGKSFDFDIRSILPKQLERLYLHGVFKEFEWEGLARSLANVEDEFPNLKKIRVQSLNPTTGAEEVIGNAKRPPNIYGRPPGSLINEPFR